MSSLDFDYEMSKVDNSVQNVSISNLQGKNNLTLITEHVETSKTSKSTFQSFASTLPVLTINNSSNVTIDYNCNCNQFQI